MKLLLRITLFAGLTSPISAFAANMGVSVSIGEPGFYGQINLGSLPPQVYSPQPMIIETSPIYSGYAPIYLRVHTTERHQWSRYCARYNACGRPVYFVQDSWYHNTYAPQYRLGTGNNQHLERNNRGAERRNLQPSNHSNHGNKGNTGNHFGNREGRDSRR